MAAPLVDLPPLREPEPDHPLLRLYQAYNTIRDEAIRHHERCERIAPTPMRLCDPDPADALTGDDLLTYTQSWAHANAYANAAHQQHQALMSVLDALGGP